MEAALPPRPEGRGTRAGNLMDKEWDLPDEEFVEDEGIDRKEDEESAAILVAAYKDKRNRPMCEEYLQELESLADTFGVTTVAKMACSTRKIDAATYLQKGKLEEIKEEAVRTRANLVIFDEEISPAQQRNLEKWFAIPVMDRTELILEIFAQRAQTKEARLQVELAKTKYQFPRLKRLWSHFSRQRASGGFLKGEGEKQLEIDRRLLKKQIEKLVAELEEVKRYRETQSMARRRGGTPSFAIIGYTNAGKSTLLNALTQANVFVEDKLFATLDPTTRKFLLPNNQEILLTDTVGFIRKLPHHLIAAFRSTLEAALHDDVLLHLIDVSHPMAESQAETTHKLLKELGASETAIITVLNKVDLCTDQVMIDRMRDLYPKIVLVSALNHTGFEELTQMMVKELLERRKTVKLRVPQSAYSLVTTLRREGNILHEEYEENDVIVLAEVPIDLLHHFAEYRIDE